MDEYTIEDNWQRILDKISNLKIGSGQKRELLESHYKSMTPEEQEIVGDLNQYTELM